MIKKYLLLPVALLLLLPNLAFAQETMTIKLYFHSEKLNPNQDDCNKVFPVTRQIPKTAAVATTALQELLKGTTSQEREQGFWSLTPEETAGAFKSINVVKGAAYVNFNKIVYEKLGTATTSCGGGFWAMVEETLKQFPMIKKVFYAIEGSPKDFYDWVQVGECPKELKKCSGKNFK